MPKDDRIPEGVCKDYMFGRCSRSVNCKFDHPPGREGSLSASSGGGGGEGDRDRGKGGAKAEVSPRKQPHADDLDVCRDYKMGRCQRASCRYAHPGQPAEEAERNASGAGDICRDFLKGECARSNCRFRHPGPEESRAHGKRDLVNFCHDFQNMACPRPTCKYTHGTKEDEEQYNATGQLPHYLLRCQYGDPEVPICKDYIVQGRDCNRRNSCKFRHLSERELGIEKDNLAKFAMGPPRGSFGGPLAINERIKRRRDDDWPDAIPANGSFGGSRGTEIVRLLEDENIELKSKIDDLKRQLADLANTNDGLLEQNGRLRTQLKEALGAGLQQELGMVSVPMMRQAHQRNFMY